jgi:glycosyltransferase involved in cell wall biosynthesis
MRIVQIVPHYFPAIHFGGPQRVAHSLGAALVKAGHEVVVCTTNLANESQTLDCPVDRPIHLDGVVIYYEPTVLTRYWGFSPWLWRRAAHEIAAADLVLVHAHYQFANWAGARLARKYRRPYVVFAHGSLHEKGISHKNSFLKMVYLRILERNNLRKAMFIAFNALEEKESSLYRESGRVIPSGVNTEEFKSLASRGEFRKRYPVLKGKVLLLFLGRLDIRHKGLDLLLPAFAEISRDRPTLSLVLAGPEEGGSGDEIRRLAKEYGIGDKLILTGLIGGEAKLAALLDADAFLLPSRFEGLSIALLEAMYAGLPVVVTDRVGLWRQIQESKCGFVVPFDKDSIAKAICRMAESDERAEMGRRAHELVSKSYTWPVITQNLLSQIEDAMACR